VNGSTDPITDKPFSTAFMYEEGNQGLVALRCRNDAADILLKTNEPTFKVGDPTDVTLRFGSGPPVILSAIATEPNLLALRHNRDATIFLPFSKTNPIFIRFNGLYGSQNTMKFQSVLLANSLHMVGRVLADCNIAPYPKAEIAKATEDMQKQTSTDEKTLSKKERHRR
jgi:hypothetical protein